MSCLDSDSSTPVLKTKGLIRDASYVCSMYLCRSLLDCLVHETHGHVLEKCG